LFSNWHVRGMGVGGHGIGMRSGNWGRGIDRLFFEFWCLDLGCTLGWSMDRLVSELWGFESWILWYCFVISIITMSSARANSCTRG